LSDVVARQWFEQVDQPDKDTKQAGGDQPDEPFAGQNQAAREQDQQNAAHNEIQSRTAKE